MIASGRWGSLRQHIHDQREQRQHRRRVRAAGVRVAACVFMSPVCKQPRGTSPARPPRTGSEPVLVSPS
eukprot:10866741-Alexandrium_andersonii.AAC.1